MLSVNITIEYLANESFEKILVYLIAIPSCIGFPIGVVNCILLAYTSIYWKQVRNKAINENDVKYKTATVNYVKYGLSSLIIFFELVSLFIQFLNQVCQKVCTMKYSHINIPLYDVIQYQLSPGFSFVFFTVVISLFNMLCLFSVQVVSNSNIDFHILHRECKRTFWLCILIVTLTTIDNNFIEQVGKIVTSIIQIYFSWSIYKQLRKLYTALKSKCLDYFYEPKKRKIFTSQVMTFKWSSLVVGIFGGGMIVSNAVLTVQRCTFGYVIFNLIPPDYSQVIYGYTIGITIIRIIERISVVNWAIVSTLLHCILLFTFIQKALKYRQLVSKPFHIKLMPRDYGQRLVYKRVNY